MAGPSSRQKFTTFTNQRIYATVSSYSKFEMYIYSFMYGMVSISFSENVFIHPVVSAPRSKGLLKNCWTLLTVIYFVLFHFLS